MVCRKVLVGVKKGPRLSVRTVAHGLPPEESSPGRISTHRVYCGSLISPRILLVQWEYPAASLSAPDSTILRMSTVASIICG